MTHIILPPYEGKCTFNVLRHDGDNSTRPRAAPSAQTIISHNILEGGGGEGCHNYLHNSQTV